MKHYGDITKLNGAELPTVDVITGGSRCRNAIRVTMAMTNHRIKDISGMRFGRLTAIEIVGRDKRRNALWRCKCDCGGECVRATCELTRNQVHSCGCFAKDHIREMCKANITHGMSKSRLIGCYKAMMSRCYREKDIHYHAYGERGISVCDEWRGNRKAFIDWALGNGYDDNLTLELVNVNGNYEPSNCTWIPMKDQYKNKQTSPQYKAVSV